MPLKQVPTSYLIQIILFLIIIILLILISFIIQILHCHLLLLILRQLILLVLILLLAIHQLIQVILKVHLLICTITNLRLPLTKQIYQELLSITAIDDSIGIMLQVVLICYVPRRSTYHPKGIFFEARGVEIAIIWLARYFQRVLGCRIKSKIDYSKLFQIDVTLLNSIIIHLDLQYSEFKRILFLLLLLLLLVFLLQSLLLHVHLVRRIHLHAASELGFLVPALLVVFVAVVNNDGRVVFFD